MMTDVLVRDDRLVRRVNLMLVASAVCLAAQVATTRYDSAEPGAALNWFGIGLILLVLVRLRSRVARALVVIGGWFGAVVYGLVALDDPSAVVLCLTFLGQAVPLMTPEVRAHVRRVRTPSGRQAA